MHEPYALAKEYPHGTDEVPEHKVYSALFCSTTVLYPTASTQLSDLPAAIERKYKSALKVRYIEPNACAVLVGRTLEAACNHEKAQQLKELRNLGAPTERCCYPGAFLKTIAV